MLGPPATNPTSAGKRHLVLQVEWGSAGWGGREILLVPTVSTYKRDPETPITILLRHQQPTP